MPVCQPEIGCRAGHQLLRLDLRTSPAEPEAAVVVHSRSPGEDLLALSAPQQGSDLLALATSRSILLLDGRQPRSALLKWDQGWLLAHCRCHPSHPSFVTVP